MQTEENLKPGSKLLPFVLAAAILIIDQIVKAIVVAEIPENSVGVRLFDNFIQIIHVRNLGMAFSLGTDAEPLLRVLLFVVLPVAALIAVTIYVLRSKSVTRLQRWAIAGIIGGGLGNLVDRIFRPDGVVDFISVKFFGLFGWDRFPTFNIADSALTIFGITLFFSLIASEVRARKGGEERSR